MANPLRRLFDPGDWIAVKPRLDPEAVSLTFEHEPSRGEIKLRIGVGTVVLCVVAVVVYFVQDSFARFVACGFGLFGLLNLIYGLIQSGFQMSLAITPDEVKVRKKTLFGARSWNEPLSRYRGVRLRETQVRDQGVGNIESTRRYQIVELVHDDDAKTVPLFVSQDSDPPRELHEAFARRLRLPTLSPDSGGDQTRAVEDLDQPVRRRGPAGDPGPPPPGVIVERSVDAARISIGTGRFGGGLVMLFWLSVPLLFAFIGYQIEPLAALLAGGMAALFVLMMLGLGRLMAGDRKQPAVCFSDERVWIDRPRFETPAFIDATRTVLRQFAGAEPRDPRPILESLPLGAVEQIRVDTYVSHRDEQGSTPHARLSIEADAGRLEYIGTQFDRKKLEWVRDYLEYEWSREE